MTRFGIVGFGRFAELTILPGIRASGVAQVVAIQKRTLSAARTLAATHDIPFAYDSAVELVKNPEVDAVFIVSANGAHARETLAAARAGKHVLVEKPMAASVKQAASMVEACRQAKVTLMVGHMVRLSPVVVRMKQLIAEGSIGRVIHVSSEFFYDHRYSHRKWLFDRKIAGGGPIFDVGVHCLDTIRFLLDEEVTSVKGFATPRPNARQTERSAMTLLTFSGGATASIFSSFEIGYRRSFIEVRGTEGTLSAFDFTRSNATVHLHIVRPVNGDPLPAQVEVVQIPDLYAEEVRQFVHAIETRSDPPITGHDGLVNQKLLERMLKGG